MSPSRSTPKSCWHAWSGAWSAPRAGACPRMRAAPARTATLAGRPGSEPARETGTLPGIDHAAVVAIFKVERDAPGLMRNMTLRIEMEHDAPGRCLHRTGADGGACGRPGPRPRRCRPAEHRQQVTFPFAERTGRARVAAGAGLLRGRHGAVAGRRATGHGRQPSRHLGADR